MKKPTPAAPKEEHTEIVMIRITPSQKAAFLAAAEPKGLKLSAWLRMVALEAIRPKK